MQTLQDYLSPEGIESMDEKFYADEKAFADRVEANRNKRVANTLEKVKGTHHAHQ